MSRLTSLAFSALLVFQVAPAEAATISKLPDILSNAQEEVTTDSLNRTLLDLMERRDAAASAAGLERLAPAAGPEYVPLPETAPATDPHPASRPVSTQR